MLESPSLLSLKSVAKVDYRAALPPASVKIVNNKITIMVVDDQAVVRQGFVSLINTVTDMEVIAEGINGQQAIDLYREHKPDVTLIDLRMPVLGGVEAITAVRREFPDARLIVLTTYDGDEDIYRSLQAGARGYLLKDVFFEELETAIRNVHTGSRHIPAAIAERLVERMSGSDLTSREMEVLELIVQGQSNKEIGTSLSISEATVKSHINNILSKLGVTDRTQAATTALQRGLVHLR
ncbi:MAG TPA: response regulator transcription factor [Pyrinomonadaceae bacterium]|jgi:two-component system NarL family response regulator|nr:response regulator transcription factor [Pyrinomonadaceae bacterium]